MKNPQQTVWSAHWRSLRHCLTDETNELMDLLMTEFLMRHGIGKNDLAMVNAFLVGAATMIAAHCQRTGEDHAELVKLCSTFFAQTNDIMNNRIGKKQP